MPTTTKGKMRYNIRQACYFYYVQYQDFYTKNYVLWIPFILSRNCGLVRKCLIIWVYWIVTCCAFILLSSTLLINFIAVLIVSFTVSYIIIVYFHSSLTYFSHKLLLLLASLVQYVTLSSSLINFITSFLVLFTHCPSLICLLPLKLH